MRKHDDMISLEDGYTAEDLVDLYNGAVDYLGFEVSTSRDP